MKIIGVTGGIASGKSTVTAYLRKQNIPVFDADASAHDAVRLGSPCLAKIHEIFGDEILMKTGELDRKALATLVFSNKEALKKLENIIHGYVWAKAQEFIAAQKKEKIIVLDVPLLIECGWYTSVDAVWLIKISEEEQIKRAIKRNNITEGEVRARIKAQMPFSEKQKYATTILDNSGSISSLEKQVSVALRTI
ncbi:Dephospho-CoA kinase [bioreactor metagenome]|jgi:dephospho-CoA kinase|uniref:Dephospho-CoA kinase n=1 Tax=bioreactor metagenome TaxID=1076179 RepID=A0A644VL49_9ZZZZ|nr:dephospho-CoA kinase [Acidaminococcaceae bacterium]NLU44908.1 dephospho-CoA kinase [Acholeplasmataceae bacterium]